MLLSSVGNACQGTPQKQNLSTLIPCNHFYTLHFILMDHSPDHNYSEVGANYRIVLLTLWPFLYLKCDFSKKKKPNHQTKQNHTKPKQISKKPKQT